MHLKAAPQDGFSCGAAFLLFAWPMPSRRVRCRLVIPPDETPRKWGCRLRPIGSSQWGCADTFPWQPGCSQTWPCSAGEATHSPGWKRKSQFPGFPARPCKCLWYCWCRTTASHPACWTVTGKKQLRSGWVWRNGCASGLPCGDDLDAYRRSMESADSPGFDAGNQTFWGAEKVRR